MSQNYVIMTWVATSWNVRCDKVVNISHVFDNMLLMSQNVVIMTWVATSWNVRCDSVVNISHTFDDMLLMSQNDMIMAWIADVRWQMSLYFQYLTSIWKHVVDVTERCDYHVRIGNISHLLDGKIVASELKDPICPSNECQIGSFSSEATKCCSCHKPMCLSRGGCCMLDVSCQDLVISQQFGHNCSQMVASGRNRSYMVANGRKSRRPNFTVTWKVTVVSSYN